MVDLGCGVLITQKRRLVADNIIRLRGLLGKINKFKLVFSQRIEAQIVLNNVECQKNRKYFLIKT